MVLIGIYTLNSIQKLFKLEIFMNVNHWLKIETKQNKALNCTVTWQLHCNLIFVNQSHFSLFEQMNSKYSLLSTDASLMRYLFAFYDASILVHSFVQSKRCILFLLNFNAFIEKNTHNLNMISFYTHLFYSPENLKR